MVTGDADVPHTAYKNLKESIEGILCNAVSRSVSGKGPANCALASVVDAVSNEATPSSAGSNLEAIVGLSNDGEG